MNYWLLLLLIIAVPVLLPFLFYICSKAQMWGWLMALEQFDERKNHGQKTETK